MKVNVLIILIFFCATQLSFTQEDGVASLAIPVRNSLRFNRFNLSPTFSFVREQNKYISFTNKREWVQFDDAPMTYLASFSGRFSENIGVGVGLFQQNYGVLTSFGGILNFAYNARLAKENNLTFGLNLGVYKSGINVGNVVTNTPDPSLNNIPSNFLLSISPGINYGTQFFDFGVSVNNLVQYNMNASAFIEDDPRQSIQAHAMYTGYMDSGGFFDESKFSTLVRSEFQKDNTIISGVVMLTVPKGIWGQVGYNSMYGFSGGLGLNITEQIAIEYNFEKAVGDLTTFGPSHEITLAYKFNKKENYFYGGNDEETAFVIPKKRRKVIATASTSAEIKARKARAEQTRLAQETASKAKADEEARIAEEKLKEKELQAQIKKEEEARLAQEAVAKTKADEEARIAEEKLKEIELQAQIKKEEEVRLAQEAAVKAKADEEARIAEEKLKEIELQAQIKKEEEARLAQKAVAKAKADEEARIAEEKLREIELQAQIKKEEEARLAQEAVAKAKADEEARIAEEKLKEIELNAKGDKDSRLTAEDVVQLDITHKDELAVAMFKITETAEASKVKQEQLLAQLNEAVENKNNDLKDLKEENDLSEQGIYQEPKPFKSVAAENQALEALLIDVDNSINERNKNIKDLENQYNERLKKVPNKNDATNQYYLNTIQNLKVEQERTIKAKASLITRLDAIKIGIEFERKRRIKRAVYDNEEDRYQKDRAALNLIKQTTAVGTSQFKEEDFDFGEERILDNIQIVKNVMNEDNGYYVVLAIHTDVNKRNDFVTKTIASGRANIDFFYDVNTSKYYIYYEKFYSIDQARKAIQNSEKKPYSSKMSIVKIEN
ncbi:MAG: PorP/SprF family type IX secretion system membrane protein [Flavobacteriaceae bacterium]